PPRGTGNDDVRRLESRLDRRRSGHVRARRLPLPLGDRRAGSPATLGGNLDPVTCFFAWLTDNVRSRRTLVNVLRSIASAVPLLAPLMLFGASSSDEAPSGASNGGADAGAPSDDAAAGM